MYYKYYHLKTKEFILLYNSDEIIYVVDQPTYNEFTSLANSKFEQIDNNESMNIYKHKNLTVSFVASENYSIIIKKNITNKS